MFFAPNINSYKRFAAGSFAPTALAWGMDNRTCAFRVVGHGPSLRVENRLPGGDVNPYLALAAMIAAGLDGIERDLPPALVFTGNAYEADLPRVPKTLHEAARTVCRERFYPGGVRRGRGRPLRQHGEGRAGRLQRHRYRLGTIPVFRKDVGREEVAAF